MDKWTKKKKKWTIHTKECYSTLEGKEILTPATTRMKLEDILQSEISQDKYWIPVT